MSQSKDIPPPLPRRLREVRSALMDPDSPSLYLAKNRKTFENEVLWKRVGRANILMTTASVLAVEKAEQLQANSENGNIQQSTVSTSSTPPLLQPALLSTIIFIDVDDCWLTPCGHWKGPSQIAKKFEDIRLSFHGKAPPHEIFAQDFKNIVTNSQYLMQRIASTATKTTTFLVPSKSGGDAIRFRHVVFEVRP